MYSNLKIKLELRDKLLENRKSEEYIIQTIKYIQKLIKIKKEQPHLNQNISDYIQRLQQQINLKEAFIQKDISVIGSSLDFLETEKGLVEEIIKFSKKNKSKLKIILPIIAAIGIFSSKKDIQENKTNLINSEQPSITQKNITKDVINTNDNNANEQNNNNVTKKEITPYKNRGVKQAGFYVLNNSPCPAALVEVGFMSNDLEKEFIINNCKKLAYLIAQGILETGSQKIIILDAGHGGKDAGAVNNETLEKDLNLKITLHIQEYLQLKNIKTILTRNKDEYISLKQRTDKTKDITKIFGQQKEYNFISIHINSVKNKTASGHEVYCVSKEGQKIAQSINNQLKRITYY